MIQAQIQRLKPKISKNGEPYNLVFIEDKPYFFWKNLPAGLKEQDRVQCSIKAGKYS